MAECRYGDVVEQCSLADKYVYPIYNGLDQSPLAAWIKDSAWIVPWAGAVHLLALALLGGAIFMIDMRVFGYGPLSQTPAALNRTVRPLMIGALLLAIMSGLTLAFGELMKLYYSPPYWMKMASLAAAVVFTFGVRNRVIREPGALGIANWVALVVSLALWIVAFAILSNGLARWALFLLVASLAAAIWFGRTPDDRSLWIKAASATSIILWLTTAASGRWIAFY